MKVSNPSKRKTILVLTALVNFVMLVSLMACGQTVGTGGRPRRVTSENARTVTLKSGGNLQAALDAANYGDTIILQAGASYTTPTRSPFILRAKPGATGTAADYITIRSSNANLLPAGRVSPSDSANMARVVALSNQGAFQTEIGAKYYKISGLEVTNSSKGTEAEFASVLVLIANETASASSINNIWIDRCYIHPQEAGTTNYLRTAAWGIAIGSPLNGPNTNEIKITNNHISGFLGNYAHAPKEQINSQAMGINLVTNLLIDNNFLQGFFQPVFIGGVNNVNASNGVVQATPAPTLTNATLSKVTNLAVGDYISFKQTGGYPNANGRITAISGNNISFTSLNRYQSTATPPVVGSTAEWKGDIANNIIITHNTFDIETVNANFEFNRTDCPGREGQPCRRVSKGYIEIKQGDNILIEGNIFQGWPSTIAPNSVNQDGTTPWAVIKNLTFRNNWIKNFGNALQAAWGNPDGGPGGHLSADGTNIVIDNNLFTQTNDLPSDWGATRIGTWGSGQGIIVRHNTWAMNPRGEAAVLSAFGPVAGLNFQDNILYYNRYGINCGLGQFSLCYPNWSEKKNVLVNNSPNMNADIQREFPNSFIATNSSNPLRWVGMNPLIISDWRLQTGSPYKGKASDGKDPGVDIDALQKALEVGRP